MIRRLFYFYCREFLLSAVVNFKLIAVCLGKGLELGANKAGAAFGRRFAPAPGCA